MFQLDSKSMLRIMSPKMMAKAFKAFDRHTVVVVSAAWTAALFMVLMSLYSLWLISTAKKDVAAAEATEPSLPLVVNQVLTKTEADPLIDRLQKRFPELSFSLGGDQSFVVSAADGSRYRSWLTALSYIDTISPQYRWSIRDFCVGSKCGSNEPLMKAILVAEKISFSAAN